MPWLAWTISRGVMTLAAASLPSAGSRTQPTRSRYAAIIDHAAARSYDWQDRLSSPACVRQKGAVLRLSFVRLAWCYSNQPRNHMYTFDGHGSCPSDRGAPTQDTALIIDDDIGTRLTLGRMLRRISFQALTAANSYDGIALFEQYAPYIACVLLGQAMQALPAAETLRRLRAINPWAPILLIRSHPEPLTPLLEHKQVFVIAKPFTIEQFHSAVRRALGS
jgi:CheY-like chemotaxis protein